MFKGDEPVTPVNVLKMRTSRVGCAAAKEWISRSCLPKSRPIYHGIFSQLAPKESTCNDPVWAAKNIINYAISKANCIMNRIRLDSSHCSIPFFVPLHVVGYYVRESMRRSNQDLPFSSHSCPESHPSWSLLVWGTFLEPTSPLSEVAAAAKQKIVLAGLWGKRTGGGHDATFSHEQL